MKLKITLLDEVELDIHVTRSADGGWTIDRLFTTFLERRGHPHVSLFAALNDGRVTPHFTAFRGTCRQFRRTLGRLRPERLEQFGKRLTEEGLRRNAELVVPVDLHVLGQNGWTVHWMDFQAVRRWLIGACRHGGRLRLDNEIAETLAWHVVRHGAQPVALTGLNGWARCISLRWSSDNIAEARALLHYPEGVWAPNQHGELVQQRPPGWYQIGSDRPTAESLGSMINFEPLERALRRIESHLDWFPRSSSPHERAETEAFVGFVFGFYAFDVFGLALETMSDPAEAE